MSKTIFVLSGDGAKGAFQLGVMKELEKQGIKPDLLYGTSSGALNSAGYSYMGIEGLEKFWRSVSSRSDVFSFSIWNLLRGAGFYNNKPLRKKLEQAIESKKPSTRTVISRVSLLNGMVEYVDNTKVSEKDFIDALLDSSTIPVVVDPRSHYVDGGTRDLLPFRQALKEQPTRVVVISSSPIKPNLDDGWKMPKGWMKLPDVAVRTLEIALHEIFLNDMRKCRRKGVEVLIYTPENFPESSALDFDKKSIDKLIALGEQVAKKKK